MKNLISIDLKSDLGFFKNPQFNGELESKHYGFDSIHKLSLLGIFGSLLGLKSVKNCEGVFPEYYEKLNHLEIGIQILSDIKKTWSTTNSSSGLFSKEKGGNLILKYQLLINPEYRIYVFLDDTNELEKNLYDILKNNFVGYFGDIYFGKSTFTIRRSNFIEYKYNKIRENKGMIETIFEGDYDLETSRFNKNNNVYELDFIFSNNKNIKYERCVSLPKDYIQLKDKFKYGVYVEFNHTNKDVFFKSDNLYKLENGKTVYLF